MPDFEKSGNYYYEVNKRNGHKTRISKDRYNSEKSKKVVRNTSTKRSSKNNVKKNTSTKKSSKKNNNTEIPKLFAPCMRDKGTIGKKRHLEMITYEVLFFEGSKRYQAQGKNPLCKGILTRFVSKDVAMQWEKATGKKIKIIKETLEQKKKREEEDKIFKERQKMEKILNQKTPSSSYYGEYLHNYSNTNHNTNNSNTNTKKVLRRKVKKENVNIDTVIRKKLQKVQKETLYNSIVQLHFRKKHNSMVYEYKVRVGKCPQTNNYIYEVIIENVTDTNMYQQVMNKTLVSTEKSLLDNLLKS